MEAATPRGPQGATHKHLSTRHCFLLFCSPSNEPTRALLKSLLLTWVSGVQRAFPDQQ